MMGDQVGLFSITRPILNEISDLAEIGLGFTSPRGECALRFAWSDGNPTHKTATRAVGAMASTSALFDRARLTT
jgi:hypothetical protein